MVTRQTHDLAGGSRHASGSSAQESEGQMESGGPSLSASVGLSRESRASSWPVSHRRSSSALQRRLQSDGSREAQLDRYKRVGKEVEVGSEQKADNNL